MSGPDDPGYLDQDSSAHAKTLEAQAKKKRTYNSAKVTVYVNGQPIGATPVSNITYGPHPITFGPDTVVVDLDEPLTAPVEPVCECGAAKTGIKAHSPGHSTWCPVA